MKTFNNYILEARKVRKFNTLPLIQQINKLSRYPYKMDRYYHITNCDNIDSILQNGITTDEIWVTKHKPHPEYNTGCCVELELDGMEVHPDPRWSARDNVYIVNDGIPPERITNVFIYLDDHHIREDELATMVSGKQASKDEIRKLLNKEQT